MADDNVLFTNSTKLMSELQKRGTAVRADDLSRRQDADQHRDGLQPADARAACSSTASDLADLRLMDYREQLASVLQENFLFDGTIAENVGYAKPGATLDEIKEACRIAHCDNSSARSPRGSTRVVGERGV